MASTLVALAAGVGSRYGGLKQLEAIGPGGETILEYSVYDALRAGFSKVVLVVRPETESRFREAFAEGMAREIPITYVYQTVGDLPPGFDVPSDRVRPWGTGHAVLQTESEVEGDFAVINADDFYGAESYRSLARFFADSNPERADDYAMVGFELGKTLSASGSVSRAVCRLDERGNLERIVEVLEVWKHSTGGVYIDNRGEQIEIPGDAIVSMNLWGFRQTLFPELRSRFERFLNRENTDDQAELLIPEVVQALVREGRVEVEVLDGAGRWCGITYPEDRERVARVIESLIESGDYPERLWS